MQECFVDGFGKSGAGVDQSGIDLYKICACSEFFFCFFRAADTACSDNSHTLRAVAAQVANNFRRFLMQGCAAETSRTNFPKAFDGRMESVAFDGGISSDDAINIGLAHNLEDIVQLGVIKIWSDFQ